MIIENTWQSGFYRPGSIYTPAHPSLWRGVIGAWCPCLGNTGAKLWDLSGNGLHCEIPSGTSDATNEFWEIDRQQAIVRPGASGQDDEFRCVVDEPISATLTEGSVTLWMRLDSYAAYAGIFNFGKPGTNSLGSQSTIHIGLSNSSPRIRALTGTGYSAQATSGLQTGVWQHITARWDAATGMELLIDGVSSATDASGSGAPYDAEYRLSIAGRNNTTYNDYDGAIDDIRFYSRRLSDAEVKLLGSARGVAYHRVSGWSTGFEPVGGGPTSHTGFFTEAAAAGDVNSVIASFQSSVSDSSDANDSLATLAAYQAPITEATQSDDTVVGGVAFTATYAESTNADDSFSSTFSVFASVGESSATGDTLASLVAIGGSVTESATTDETLSVLSAYSETVTESAFANDSVTGVASFFVAYAESTGASDSYTGINLNELITSGVIRATDVYVPGLFVGDVYQSSTVIGQAGAD